MIDRAAHPLTSKHTLKVRYCFIAGATQKFDLGTKRTSVCAAVPRGEASLQSIHRKRVQARRIRPSLGNVLSTTWANTQTGQ